MDDIFDKTGCARFINRINQLNKDAEAKWGKMNAAQMMAHCAYAHEKGGPKPTVIGRLKIKFFARSTVIGDKPYPQGMKTSPAFHINDHREFEAEKKRLVSGIERTHKLGAAHFENRRHGIFGRLTSMEWSTFFSKHLDHHLRQFGV